MIFFPMGRLVESLFPLQVWELRPQQPDLNLSLEDWPVAHAWIVGKYEDYAQQQAARLEKLERLLEALVVAAPHIGNIPLDGPIFEAYAQARAFLAGKDVAE